MDHVLNNLRQWLEIYSEDENPDKKAIKCINEAIKEINLYWVDEETGKRL